MVEEVGPQHRFICRFRPEGRHGDQTLPVRAATYSKEAAESSTKKDDLLASSIEIEQAAPAQRLLAETVFDVVQCPVQSFLF